MSLNCAERTLEIGTLWSVNKKNIENKRENRKKTNFTFVRKNNKDNNSLFVNCETA